MFYFYFVRIDYCVVARALFIEPGSIEGFCLGDFAGGLLRCSKVGFTTED
jgi:hypothetical protein